MVNTEYKNTRNTDEYVARRIKETCPDLTYLDGYINRSGRVRVRCDRCGDIFTRNYNALVYNKHEKRLCQNCERIKKEQAEHKKECEKKLKKHLKQIKKIYVQMEMVPCRECGTLFLPKTKRSIFCSTKCSHKHQGRINGTYTLSSDSRLNKDNIVDRDINLRALAERDNDICWLCGEAVDWNDYTIRDDGVYITGDMYPSIDHVIPLAKGGMHAWDNVRLTHRCCNSKKHTKIL